MSKKHSPSEFPLGIHRVTDTDKIDYDVSAAVVRKLLHTREVRQLLGNILPEVLNVYAGKSRVKKFITRLVGRHLSKSLSRSGDILETREIEKLFEDETFIRKVTEPLPDMINALVELVGTAVDTIEGLETGEKKALFGELISRMGTGQTGGLITQGCRILTDIHKDDPEFFAKTLEPGFRKWVEAIDFGELKEAVDNSAADARALVVMANNVFWEYPAKVVLLLSLLPSVVNMLTDSLDISLHRMNELPPDLLTDVILSFVNEIEAKPVSRLVNEVTELIRKVHTGSGLLGEPGAPQLPKVLSGKIDEIAEHTDPVALWKAKMALAETGAAINRAMVDAVNNRPALKQLSMIKGPEIANIHIKSVNQALSYWEGVADADTAKSFSQNLSAYDVQEFAEAVNNLLRIFNRLGDQQPEFLPQFIGQFTSAVDDYELSEAAEKLFGQDQGSVAPAARAVMPAMIKWVCGVLSPADDEYEADAQEARDALQNLFLREEV